MQSFRSPMPFAPRAMSAKPQSRTIADAVRIALEHHQAGRLPEAERTYQRILDVDPNNADALHLLGVIAHQLGKNELAVQLIDKALTGRPDFAGALFNRGLALQALQRYDEALAGYTEALTMLPNSTDIWMQCGISLHQLQRYDKALASYDRALALKPTYAEALNNRSGTLQELGRYDEALASCNQALVIRPAYAEALFNRGRALQRLNRYDEALASYDQALTISPAYAEAFGNRGAALQALGRYDDALASYDQALVIRPEDAEVHWNRSLCRLVVGDFERGWQEYEWRWKWGAFPAARRNFSQPLWLGKEDLAGKSILLHSEQGLGDTIQFSRYAQAVAQKGARVILEVQPTLKALLATISGAHQVLGHGDALPEFDFHCPLLSLPLAFRTQLGTIPQMISLAGASVEAVGKWESKLGCRKAPRVGIAWSGRPAHANDQNRSLALSRLVPLENFGVRLVSLQNELRIGDEGVLAAYRQILHFGADLKEFSDTAALVTCMDLVISVDTAVAHLAAALGKTVWILLPFHPDWRWLLAREDCPWYPTARLFRQPRIGDWDSVIEVVKVKLSEHMAPSC